MGKHKDSLGWSLQLRGNTWFVYHRITPDGRLVGRSTRQKEHEEAIRATLDIVAEARREVKSVAGESYYVAHLESLATKAKEEELLLGKELDKSNPRMSTLWTLAPKRGGDTGIFHDWVKKNLSDANFRGYRCAWRYLTQTHPDVHRINEITPKHMEECIERKRGKVTELSLSLYWGVTLRSIFKILIQQGWYHSENPSPQVKMSSNRRPVQIVRTISDEQVEALAPIFDAFEPAYGLFFQIGIHTGMRRSELANLLWSDIDLEHKPRAIAIVRPHDEDTEKGVVRSTLKTRRSERIVPLKTELIEYLRPHRKPVGYVIESAKYKISRTQMQLPMRLMNQVREVCPDFHPHLMRHTFITNALMGAQRNGGKAQAPIPPVKVAMWVGDSVQMILDTYTHCIPDDSIDSF